MISEIVKLLVTQNLKQKVVSTFFEADGFLSVLNLRATVKEVHEFIIILDIFLCL